MANSKDFGINGLSQVGKQTTLSRGTTSTSTENTRIASLTGQVDSGALTGIGTPLGFDFKTDGTRFFVIESASPDEVREYSLSTAWDVTSINTTAVNVFDVSSETTGATRVRFRPNGRTMFVLDQAANTIYEYDVDPAWDLTGVTFTQSQAFSPASAGAIYDLQFNGDGTRIYFTVSGQEALSYYPLSTGYDISSLGSESTDTLSETLPTTDKDFNFVNSGANLFFNASGTMYLFSLGTSYDTTTDTFIESKAFSFPSNYNRVMMLNSGANVFSVNQTSDVVSAWDSTVTVRSFDLSSGNFFELTADAYEETKFTNVPSSQTFVMDQRAGTGFGLNVSGTATEVLSYDIAIDENNDPYPADENVFITDDGRHMMYTGSGSAVGTIIIRLNKPYDIQSGVVIDSSANISGNDGIYLRSDGRKAYFSRNSDILQYDMDTPFTMPASASHTASISGRMIYFKPDGTRFICSGVVLGSTISTFDLSTPWDLSTATDASKDFAFVASPSLLQFSPEGDRLYLNANNVAYSYSLTTPWDVTSASLLGTITIGSTGTDRMIIHSSENKIFRFEAENTEVYDISATFFSPVYRDTVNFTGGTAPTYNQDCNRKLITFSTNDGGATYYAGYKDVYI